MKTICSSGYKSILHRGVPAAFPLFPLPFPPAYACSLPALSPVPGRPVGGLGFSSGDTVRPGKGALFCPYPGETPPISLVILHKQQCFFLLFLAICCIDSVPPNMGITTGGENCAMVKAAEKPLGGTHH